MAKRLISLALVMVFVLGMIPWHSKPAEAATAGDGTYIWPVPTSSKITAGWTYPSGSHHGATDFGVAVGTSVCATAAGTVILVSDYGCLGSHMEGAKEPVCSLGNNCRAKKDWNASGTYGNFIKIDHGNNIYTIYAHLQTGSFTVSKGQRIEQGQQIAFSGNSGNSSGPHLHFEMRMGGSSSSSRVDPQKYLTKTNVGAGYFSKCGELLPSYGEVTITNACNPHPLPCSNTVAQKYNCESPAMTEKALKVGEKVTVNGIILNTENHYWYKVTLADGTQAYIFSEEAGEMTQKWPYVQGSILDDSISGSTFLGGTVITGGSHVEAIQALVYEGTATSGQAIVRSDNCGVNITDKYSLYKSDVDYSIPFQNLESYGDRRYTIAIYVEVTNYEIDKDGKPVPTRWSILAGSDQFTYDAAEGCSHSFNSSTVSPTCTNRGYTTYTCKKCGYSYTSDTTDPTGHTFTEWSVRKEPTCISEGVQTRACVDCEIMESAAIDTIGHVYSGILYDANCLEPARIVQSCITCGDWYVEYPAGEWTTEKPSGVDDALIESRTEYRYREKEYMFADTSSANGWTLYDTYTQWGEYGSWSQWSNTAVTGSDAVQVETRKVYGYYYYRCPSCGAHMHGYGNCYTWAGGCGATTTSGHWNEVWSTVSWDDAGLKDWHGTGKYYTYIDGELVFKWNSGGSKTQYRSRTREQETVYCFYRWTDWSEWSPAYMESNEEVSVETRTVYRSLENVLGEHSYAGIVTAPTCTQEGYTTHICTLCGWSFVDSYENPIGHSMNLWYETKVSDCTAKGTEQRDCAYCDYFETRETSVKDHRYTHDVIAPTCTEGGYTVHTCSVCGKSHMDSNVAELGHAYGNWYQTKAPTLEAEGEERRDCSRCDEFQTRKIQVSIAAAEDGKYYLYAGSVVYKTYTGLYDNGVANWYIVNGQVQMTHTGLVTVDGERYYIKGGCVDDFTGLKKLEGTWLNFDSGKVDTSYTGLVAHNGMLVYAKNGEVDFNKKDIVKYNGKLYYVKYGLVSTGFTGMVKGSDGVWRYIKNGVFANTYTGLAKNSVGWWYAQNGLINTSYTGLAQYNGASYYVKYGQVMLTTTGIIDIKGTKYYIKGGAWQSGFTGTYTDANGVAWNIVRGIVG